MEGRSWYTPHRGRLWIAATAKRPSPQEVSELQTTYRFLRGEGNGHDTLLAVLFCGETSLTFTLFYCFLWHLGGMKMTLNCVFVLWQIIDTCRN